MDVYLLDTNVISDLANPSAGDHRYCMARLESSASQGR